MQTLTTVLTSLRGEAGSRKRDHLDVFREFLAHLDRAAREKPARTTKAVKLKERTRRR
jgi:hypothetical protein